MHNAQPYHRETITKGTTQMTLTLNETNRIYIVAGERNMIGAERLGGLYANVGQTTRSVKERLQDHDYKHKAGGGEWKILSDQNVGSLFSDHDLHPHLKSHPDVTWNPNSSNTEEFLFKNDPGDGSVAKKIVGDLLKTLCLPLIQKEVKRLQAEDFVSKDKIVSLSARVDELSSSEHLEALNTKVNRLEKELFVKNQELDDKNKELSQTIKSQKLNTTTILNRFEKELDDKNNALFCKNKELDDKNEELAQTIKSQNLKTFTIVNRLEKEKNEELFIKNEELDDKNEELTQTIKSQNLKTFTIVNRLKKELDDKDKELDDKDKELFVKNEELDDKNEELAQTIKSQKRYTIVTLLIIALAAGKLVNDNMLINAFKAREDIVLATSEALTNSQKQVIERQGDLIRSLRNKVTPPPQPPAAFTLNADQQMIYDNFLRLVGQERADRFKSEQYIKMNAPLRPTPATVPFNINVHQSEVTPAAPVVPVQGPLDTQTQVDPRSQDTLDADVIETFKEQLRDDTIESDIKDSIESAESNERLVKVKLAEEELPSKSSEAAKIPFSECYARLSVAELVELANYSFGDTHLEEMCGGEVWDDFEDLTTFEVIEGEVEVRRREWRTKNGPDVCRGSTCEGAWAH